MKMRRYEEGEGSKEEIHFVQSKVQKLKQKEYCPSDQYHKYDIMPPIFQRNEWFESDVRMWVGRKEWRTITSNPFDSLSSHI